jgi:hypothetical protein
MKLILAWLLTTVTLCISQHSFGATYVSTGLEISSGPPAYVESYDSRLDPAAQDRTWLQHEILAPYPRDARSFAYLDMSQGTLKIAAKSDLLVNALGQFDGLAAAAANIQDQLSFGNFNPGDHATLHYYLHAVLKSGPIGQTNPYNDFAVLGIGTGYGGSVNTNAAEYLCYQSDFRHPCGGPGEYWINGVYSFEMSSIPVDLIINLYAQTTFGNQILLDNTARLYLEVPTGATFSSASGVLFATASPVPEVPILAMLLSGVGIVVIRGKARRASVDHQAI